MVASLSCEWSHDTWHGSPLWRQWYVAYMLICNFLIFLNFLFLTILLSTCISLPTPLNFLSYRKNSPWVIYYLFFSSWWTSDNIQTSDNIKADCSQLGNLNLCQWSHIVYDSCLPVFLELTKSLLFSRFFELTNKSFLFFYLLGFT